MRAAATSQPITLVQIAKKARVDQKLARFRLRRAIAEKKNVPTSQSTTRWEFRAGDEKKVQALISAPRH